MALVSMTGYGQAAGAQGLAVDVRTVNHRHLDVACRLPRPWGALEPEVKAAVGRHVRRGRVEVSVRPAGGAEGGGFSVDAAQAARYVEAARALERTAGLAGTLDLAGLLALPGVVVSEEAPVEAAAVRDRLLAALEEALAAAAAMRREEGAALERAIRELGVSPQDLEDFSTPTFATLHGLARRLFSQDPKLYACIQLANPANRPALRALEDAVADILYFIQRQNADGLVRLIDSVREGFIGENKDNERGE